MKKGFVILLLALAVIVLVSPAIVGRLAEKSMDENLDWAATETEEITITSLGFDRGWFSSEGQHRIELREGELHDSLIMFAYEAGLDELPVLVIDTRIDHGLVPVTSMARDKGSLSPGLGSAVSTMAFEFGSGDTVSIPGTIYSEVGLTGELRSNLVMEPGSFADGAETMNWGDVDIVITTSPSANSIGFEGKVDELVFASPSDEITVGAMTIAGKQQQSRFGFAVGDATVEIKSVTMPSAFGQNTMGPLSASERVWLDGDNVSAHGTVDLQGLLLGDLIPANIIADATIEGVDAGSVANIARAAEDFDGYGNQWLVDTEEDLYALLANGFDLRIDQLDVEMPQGTLSARATANMSPSDPDTFVLTSALMALDATLNLSVPADLMEYFVTVNPEINTAVAMGFLKLKGGAYEMEAEFSKGLLTVNGAPVPIPLFGTN